MAFSTKTILIAIVVIFALFNVSHGQEEEIEFNYVGAKGPEFWHLLSTESAICQTGKQQSPINIVSKDLEKFAEPPSPKFQDALNVESTHNGNTVEISSGKVGVPLPAEIQIDGEKYELQQFHFHTPSEHRVNGRHHDVEQHLVFESETKKISVVAVFYDVDSKESAFMSPITDNLPKQKGDTKKLKKVELSSLLSDVKNITEAFTYSGSLTTPPCTEGVTWYVNQGVQDISLNQLKNLRSVVDFNSRFTKLRVDDEQPGTVPPAEQPPSGAPPAEQPPTGAEQPPTGAPPTDVQPGTPPPTDAQPETPTTPPAPPAQPATDPATDPSGTGGTGTTGEQQSSDPYYKLKRSLYSRGHFRKNKF